MTTTTHQPICFVDTETDGLHHGKQAWEVAIIRRDYTDSRGAGGAFTETTLHAMLPLPSMRTSDPYALQVGGFWDRHPTGRRLSGKPPVPTGTSLESSRTVAESVFRLTFDAHLVGVNPAFDVEVLGSLLRGEGLIPRWDYHLGDLVAQTAGYVQGIIKANADGIHPKRYSTELAAAATLPWKSDQLAAAIGVEPAAEHERHTALGDAKWARRWHDVLTGHTAPEAGLCDECHEVVGDFYGTTILCPSCHHDAVRSGWEPTA